MQISITYILKWRLKEYPNYVWTDCKKLINLNTGREIKKTLNGLTAGYWINRKFIKLTDMSSIVELIPNNRVAANDPILKLLDDMLPEWARD